jgi:dehydrogenase/reductase SDR family member 7
MIFKGYFDSLKTEKPHIGVNIFCPGATFSNFLQECYVENVGEKYGKSVQQNDRRMTAERCGHLYAIFLANNMKLSWVGILPNNWITYVWLYFPNIRDL